MNTWIALFRGINVGGNNILPMNVLAALLERLGCDEVRTYIQSGNAVFKSVEADAVKLAKTVEDAVLKKCGFVPLVVLLSRKDLEKAAKANPFPQADAAPKTLHLAFLAEKPKNPDLAALNAVKSDTEELVLAGKVVYLYTPEGFGISKLAERYERLLGVTGTARNWNTVTKLREMAKEAG